MSIAQPERILNHNVQFDGPPPRPRLFFEVEADAVEDEAKSAREGRKCYTEKTFLCWTKVGAYNHTKTRAEVSPRNRCADEYTDVWTFCGGREFYETWRKSNGDVDPINGTPLRTWPLVNSAQIRELDYVNVRSVEDLASVTDGDAMRLGMGIRGLVEKARIWLKEAEEKGVVVEANARMQSQVTEQQAVIEEQARAIADLQAVVERLAGQAESPRRGPGRPPKNG